MNKNITNFLLKLSGFSLGLFAIHYYILHQFFEGDLVLPLWVIYAFNAVMVFVVYSVLNHYSKDENNDMLKFFLSLTIVKMGLVIVLLLPLFLKKSDHTQLEVFNFFIPYFLFLGLEIFSLNKFLQKS
jgi:drug/metabolite transporter (DMT)-like permease